MYTIFIKLIRFNQRDKGTGKMCRYFLDSRLVTLKLVIFTHVRTFNFPRILNKCLQN